MFLATETKAKAPGTETSTCECRSLTQSLDLLGGKIAFVLVNGLFSTIIIAVLYAPLKIISVPLKALYYENAVFEWTPANEEKENRSQDTVMYI